MISAFDAMATLLGVLVVVVFLGVIITVINMRKNGIESIKELYPTVLILVIVMILVSVGVILFSHLGNIS